MPIEIKVKNRDAAIKADRKKWAQSVSEASAFKIPLNKRVLAFFDDEDAECFKKIYGMDNRGFFSRTADERGTPWWREKLKSEGLPEYLLELLFSEDFSASSNKCDSEILLFDGFIYLYGSTCSDPTALVITFAHELQHSYQYEQNFSLWYHNKCLKKCMNDIAASARNQTLKRLKSQNYKIPEERDARVVAKRVAEELCTVNVVREYIHKKIFDAQQKNAIDDFRDWRWIERWDSSKQYCLKAETEKALRIMKKCCEHRLQSET